MSAYTGPHEPLAKAVATLAHGSQFRRDGVTPYIEHPRAVASKVEGDALKAVAWLHDVLEDTKLTVGYLEQAGFSSEIIEAVVALTKTKDDKGGYDAHLVRANGNDLARRVKIADILHNLSDRPSEHQIVKYAKALLFLVESPNLAPTATPTAIS